MTIERISSYFDITPPSYDKLEEFFCSLDIQDQASLLVLMNGFEIENSESFEDFDSKLKIVHDFLKKFVLDADYRLDEYVLEVLEESGVYPCFNEEIIRESLYRGFYTMGLPLFGKSFLFVKYHLNKLIIKPKDFHIPKNFNRLQKRFIHYTMTFNIDFDKTIDTLVKVYPETWLTPELVQAFKNIHKNPDDKVSLDSVEIWDEKGELIAGEIGFITKSAYASLSGFHLEKDTGTYQMCLLGKYLFENGFAYWDLGMSLPYKYRYGAKDTNRKQQEKLWKKLPEEKKSLE